MEGEGSRTFASGKTLKGKWFDSELMRGKLYNIDGTTYDGEWLGGRPHGIGVKTISAGKDMKGCSSLGGLGEKVPKLMSERTAKKAIGTEANLLKAKLLKQILPSLRLS